jgi:hypothetical protein
MTKKIESSGDSETGQLSLDGEVIRRESLSGEEREMHVF